MAQHRSLSGMWSLGPTDQRNIILWISLQCWHILSLWCPVLVWEQGTWLTTLSDGEDWDEERAAIYFGLVTPFFKLWTTCSERHSTFCDISGWLILLPWGLSDVLVALRIATVLSVWSGVRSRPGGAVYLSESLLLACTFDSSSHI